MAGNRTRASRVAGENSTTEPPMLALRSLWDVTPQNAVSPSREDGRREGGTCQLALKAREMHSLFRESFHYPQGGVPWCNGQHSESSNSSSNLGGTYKSFLSENPNLPLTVAAWFQPSSQDTGVGTNHRPVKNCWQIRTWLKSAPAGQMVPRVQLLGSSVTL